jgi:glutamine amidotransferase
MQGLLARALAEPVLQVAQRGDPLLGICVGMQALFEVGEELGEQAGLKLLPGRVVRFPDQAGLKVPHTGWNRLWPRRPDPLLHELQPGAYAYFNHSFYCRADETGDVSAETEYGLRYASVVRRDNLFGVQFHPEKSQQVGLQILANFIYL